MNGTSAMKRDRSRESRILGTILACLLATEAFAQGGGMNASASAGYNAYQNQVPSTQQTASANSSEFIAIKGSTELSVKPESLRLVFAVTAEAETSEGCAANVKATVRSISDGLVAMGVVGDRVVEDFIVVKPMYVWDLEKLEGAEILQEKKKGYRMQSNLHVLCKDEAQAGQVMDVAFKNGVSEIISFDYWHSGLDEVKQDVLRKALQAAKSKAEILLSVFDEELAILNIDSSTKVNDPPSLYRTIQPLPSDEVVVPYKWRELIRIRAHRPLTTFYAGAGEYADVKNSRPPMNPEIVVRAEVTLTYESPARKQRIELEIEQAKSKKSEG